MAMLEIRNVQKTFRTYAKPGLFHRLSVIPSCFSIERGFVCDNVQLLFPF